MKVCGSNGSEKGNANDQTGQTWAIGVWAVCNLDLSVGRNLGAGVCLWRLRRRCGSGSGRGGLLQMFLGLGLGLKVGLWAL